LNLGIKKMTGDYFSWLSHDDYYYQNKIEQQIKFLATLDNKKVFLYSNYAVLEGRQIIPVVLNHEMLVRKKKYSLLRGSVNGITVLVPKSILDEMGEFDEKLRATQDYDYWRRIEAKYEFIHMEEVLSITRIHPGQDTKVSPNVVTEGDVLWIDMIKQLSDQEKIQYEGTLYNFYFEMVKFLKTTPYIGTLEYCQSELKKAAKEIEASSFNPKVSVVIPFYNRAEKTIAALKSALNQTYKNIEVILVDDKSTDDIAKLVSFIKKYKNVTLVSLERNMGPSAARNRGIDEATGDYIAFLDSDDEFVESKIEEQIASMRKFNLSISHTSYVRRDGNKDTVIRDRYLTGLVVPKIISGASIATPTVIINRKFLNSNNIRFNEDARLGEDSIFWLECAKHSEILLLDKPLTIVNLDEGSHIVDTSKLLGGIKRILTYLLNDPYYSRFDNEISQLCKYFFEIKDESNTKELNRILVEGPVVSVAPGLGEKIPRKYRAQVKSSIPYRAARKVYGGAKLIYSKSGRIRIN
jgi:glycosyltransferase involved in cell wall biosynthesis